MKIEDMEYGYCFHVYLRKYSDTEWSSLLWNMINQLSVLDDNQPKKDKVWPAFASWCDRHWKQNPELPFYDVALAWCKTSSYKEEHGVPETGAGIMFEKAIQLACTQTREDLNAAAKYDLEYDHR
jgi:hypothetical protein